MRAFVSILISAAGALAASGASPVLTKELCLPSDGDRLTVQKVEYLPPGDSGEGVTWDFTECVPLDGFHTLRYGNRRDSIITVVQNRTRFDYRTAGDTLLWCGYTNRLYRHVDSIAPVYMVFPMQYGRSATNTYQSVGVHPDGFTTSASGVASVAADGCGTLLLPDGDSIGNVLRVHRVYRDQPRMLRPHTDDAVTPDTLPVHIYEEYAWYAAGYRYPIVQTHIDTFVKDSVVVSRMGSSWICRRAEQEGLDDSANSAVRLRNLLARYSSHGSGGGNGDNADSGSSIAAGLLTDELVSVSVGADDIAVSAAAPSDMDVEILMSDAQGRVYHRVPQHRVAAGSALEKHFPRAGMPPGVYLIAFLVKGGDDVVKKVILQ